MRNIGQVASKEGERMYLDVASKEEGGVRKVPHAMAATAGQGFLSDQIRRSKPWDGSCAVRRRLQIWTSTLIVMVSQ
jgi:hypothetical protein